MAKTYKVIYTGQLQEGVSEQQCITAFSKKFGLSEAKARQLVTAGKEVLLKKNLELEQARKYQQVLESLGMIVKLDEMDPKSLRGKLSIVPIEEDSSDISAVKSTSCPKCGSGNIIDDQCQDCGIFVSKYQQGMDKVIVYNEPDKLSEATEDFSVDNPYERSQEGASEDGEIKPLIVPASHGVAWLSSGFWHFKQNKLEWMGAMGIGLILFIVISLIPFAGSIIVNILSPVILGGLLIGANEQAKGGEFQIAHLFAGFSNKAGPLMLVGVIYLLATLLLTLVSMLVVGGLMAITGNFGMHGDHELFALMMAPGSLLMILPFSIIMMLMAMAYWYAPVLVTLEDMTAVQAMKLSFRTCLKNWRAFSIYGLLASLLLIIGAIPVFLGWLIVVPVIVASIYASYWDVFQKE